MSKETETKEGVEAAWDFWLSQHDISTPEIIKEAIKESFRAFLNDNSEAPQGKRVPLPWSTIRCGMVVRDLREATRSMCVTEMTGMTIFAGRGCAWSHGDFTRLEYLDGATWKPLWTVEAGEEKNR